MAEAVGAGEGPAERAHHAGGDGPKRWLGLFEQVFRLDKWSVCRIQAAAICGSRVKQA
jgi:hypothetical protein